MKISAKFGLFIVLVAIALFSIQLLNRVVVKDVSTASEIVPITKIAKETEYPQSNIATQPAVAQVALTKHTASRRSGRRTMTDPKSKHAKILGKHIQLGTPGKWTVVHFWATWCGACVERTPELVKLHAEYAPHGVDFFGVNLDKDPNAMAKYMSKAGIAWPQMITKEGFQSPVRIEHQVPTIPAVYLVSPQGQVVEAGIRGFKDADRRLKYHLASDLQRTVSK